MNAWSIDRLQRIFRAYADVDFRVSSAYLYAVIADRLAGDDEILAIAAEVRQGQPPPNLLFASVHYLLLSGVEHSLSAFYPDLTESPLDAADAYPDFRDFCLSHRDRIVELVRTRLIQTNVLERCGLLLPAFATAAAELGTADLAMVEIGASAGLNLLWDRYHYDYGALTWGNAGSPVRLEIDVRGLSPLPAISRELRSVWRKGVDLNPVDLDDADAFLWQQALMWPERLDRQLRLEAARALMEDAGRVDIVTGDACDALLAVLQEAPDGAGLCVFASFALYQFSKEAKARVMEIVAEHSATRPIAMVTMDIRRIGDPHGGVDLTLYGGGVTGTTRELARGHPHGSWIEWLDPAV